MFKRQWRRRVPEDHVIWLMAGEPMLKQREVVKGLCCCLAGSLLSREQSTSPALRARIIFNVPSLYDWQKQNLTRPSYRFGRASSELRMGNFRHLRTLIIDPSGYSKNLLKTLLATLGVEHVVAMGQTDYALVSLRNELFNIVFCDEMVAPHDPIAFLKALRRDLRTRDVTIPVVLVSAGADIDKIKAARDAGMSDVLTKPVSAETVERRLRALLLKPKAFVASKAFVGPDRRRNNEDRRQFGERAPDGVDRRQSRTSDCVFQIGPKIDTGTTHKL